MYMGSLGDFSISSSGTGDSYIGQVPGIVPGLPWSSIERIAADPRNSFNMSSGSDQEMPYAVGWVKFPVIGRAQIIRNGDGSIGVIAQFSNKPGYSLYYSPDNDGNTTVIEKVTPKDGGFGWVEALGLALVTAGISGALSPFTVSDTVAPTGSISATTSTGLASDEFANETAKLAQQQAIAQSGGDILNTSLPTIDLSSAPIPSSLPAATGASASLPVAQVAGAVPAITKILGATSAGSKNVTPVTGAMPGFDTLAPSQMPQFQPFAQSQGTIQPWMIYGGIGLLAAVAALAPRRRGK